MIYRIIFTRAASRDLDEIGDHIDMMAGSAVAERFVEEIIGVAETLRTMPSVNASARSFEQDFAAFLFATT